MGTGCGLVRGGVSSWACTFCLQGMIEISTARLWQVPGAQILGAWLGGRRGAAGALPVLLICKARGMSWCSQQHL